MFFKKENFEMKKNLKILVLVVLAVLMMACGISSKITEAKDSEVEVIAQVIASTPWPTSTPKILDLMQLEIGDPVQFVNGMGDSGIFLTAIPDQNGEVNYNIALLYEGIFRGWLFSEDTRTPFWQLSETIYLVYPQFSLPEDYSVGFEINTKWGETLGQYPAIIRVGGPMDFEETPFPTWISFDGKTWHPVFPT